MSFSVRAGVLGEAERFELVRNLLHGRPMPG
jgi:hypothetical protein